jgi:hypothetical protein
MKKFLFFATLVACSLLFFSCNKKNEADPNEAAIAKVKADAKGSWVGIIKPLLGDEDEGEEVTVTFTENTISTTGNLKVNITEWKCVDGKEVWVNLDDESKSAMYIAVDGDNMTLKGSSTFILLNFPGKLTRVKK